MFEQRQLIVPQLVKLLLESDEEDETFGHCLEFAQARLDNYSKPVSSPSAVWHNLAHFVDRYHCEQLQALAETIRALANVIIDDLNMTDGLKWAVLEFMLSVNFKAFRSARIHLEVYMTRRQEILEDLAAAQACSRQETRRELNLSSFRQPLDSESERYSCRTSSLAGSLELSVDAWRHGGTWPLSAQSLQRRYCHSMQETPQHNFTDALNQFQQPKPQSQSQSQPQSQQVNSSPRSPSSPILQPTTCRFALAYGEYLRRKLHNVPLALQLYGEEGFLIRELLALFFLPSDCHHFELVNHLIQLRANAPLSAATRQQVLLHFLKPLQYMQLLQLYIDCCETPGDDGDQLETLIAMTGALRRLLKPVVESLTQYERNMAPDSWLCTLTEFLLATKVSFERLQLLWSLAAATYISYPKHFSNAPHSRSQHILCSLLELTQAGDVVVGRRAYAAAMLLHVLQVHCRCLDSWWQLGEFNDWHDEFPARQLEHDARTEYVMRELSKGEPFMETCRIYKIIWRHIKDAGPALAALYDAKRLGDFVSAHKHMLEQSLHQLLLKSMHVQLKYYQAQVPQRGDTASDIFWQLKNSEDEQLRCLYYAYYKETVLDFRQPGYCSIDELLRRCQSCAVFAPLDVLICQTLERLLEQRALLLNSYVVHLLREQLPLAKTLQQLRSVYLLFDFEEFAEEYAAAWRQLEQGHFGEAAELLQKATNSQCPSLEQLFRVELPSANPAQLKLHYSCDEALASIISEQQLNRYNDAFRLRLQLQVSLHKLQQLQQLQQGEQAVTTNLFELQAALLSALRRHLQTELLLDAATKCEAGLPRCNCIVQLQELHSEFVDALEKSVRQCDQRFQHELHDLYAVARVCESLWQRVEFLLRHNISASGLTEFDVHYDDGNRLYLATVNAACKAMLCQHPLN